MNRDQNLAQKVLLVEDSEAFAVSVSTTLRSRYSYEVLVARTYHEACTIVSEENDQIFAAIVDLNLPDAEDGAAITLLVNAGIPAIAFTGTFSSELRQSVLNMGASDYVLKHSQADIDYVASMVQRLDRNRNMSVLVVEDSRSSREILQQLLERQNFSVTALSSVPEALACINDGAEFHIAVIDLIMEEVDGFELLRYLRSHYDYSDMAIIGVSGKSNNEDIAKFMKFGANDFLKKPFELEQIATRVNLNARLIDSFHELSSLNQQKNQMMGMAAHDIRGPLGSILSAASMLQARVKDDISGKLVDIVNQAASTMKSLLDELLDISAIESAAVILNKSLVDIRKVVQEVVSQYQIMADDKEISLRYSVPQLECWADVDSDRIREVIANLLSNAIKYSSAGKSVDIELSANNDKIRLLVLDEAGGIPEDEQDKLFKPFAKISTEPTGGEKSTGLGLAICRKLVDLHAGEVRYRKNQNLGSIFEVVLPVSEKRGI